MPISGTTKALMYARMGTSANVTANPFGPMRMGASRMGYYNPITLVKIGGTTRNKQFDDFSWEIIDELNEQPNTASIEVFGFTPTVGEQLTIGIGSITNKWFDGTVIKVTEAHDRLSSRAIYRVDAIDWTFLASRRLITKRWTNSSATIIVYDIVNNYLTGFTAPYVESGLATLDDFVSTFSNPIQVLKRLANRIGATMYFDYDKQLHFFMSNDPQSAGTPAAINSTNTSFRRFRAASDLSQCRTRIWVEGRGGTLLTGVLAGSTSIPLDDASAFATSGTNYAKLGPYPQVITYTGKRDGGTGSFVGPGASPSAAPAAALASGLGLATGTFQYAYTFVTAAGESMPSPVASVTTANAVADPVGTPTGTNSADPTLGTGQWVAGDSIEFALTYVTASGETLPSTVSTPVVAVATIPATSGARQIFVTTLPVSANPDVISKRLYRRRNGVWEGYHNISDPSLTHWDFSGTFLNGFTAPPVANTTDFHQTVVTGIAIGPSGTTSRKVYRTAVGGSQLKLLSTIANNTATVLGANDSTADGSLGANSPTGDTSGLAQPTGQVTQGSTTLLVSSPAPFNSAGGWVIVNGQLIRYTGISGNTLTGIPSSGTGAIGAAISYNSTVTACAELTGIPASGDGAIVWDLVRGDTANMLVQRNDTPAQTVLAALEGGDGIHEHYIQDRRLSIDGAEARGDAELTLFANKLRDHSYLTSDQNVRSGKSVAVDMSASWGISGTFRLQRVVTKRQEGFEWPQRDVNLSSQTRDFYDVLRSLRGGDEGE